MKLTPHANRPDGLTMIELLAVLACLFILVGLLLPRLGKSGVKAPVTACISNLKQVALGQFIWANDHLSTNLPASDAGIDRLLSSSDIASYYKTLSNELLSPKILTCPSDSRKPVNDFRSLTTNHLSYFLNMDAMAGIDASTPVNGDRHITFTPAPNGQIVTLTTNLSMQWTKKLGHGVMGNISFIDGSVQKTINRDLAATLLPPSNTVPQRLLFP
jgi:type II secretory pathway pseudopilin PulG